MTIEMIDEEIFNQGTLIKVIGVGGGGGNAVEHIQGCRRRVHLRQYRCASLGAQYGAQDDSIGTKWPRRWKQA